MVGDDVACSARCGRAASSDLRDAGCDRLVKTRPMAQIESTELTAPTHRSAEDRAAAGKRARAASPRRGHAEFAPAAGRPDPVEVLEGQATTRVSELIPIRYGRMLVSAFTFYRGGAALMAGDLAADAAAPTCRCSSAATRTSRTSASSPLRTGGWSSASTTSTRRCQGRSSGTSSGSSRASRSPAATAGSTPSSARSSTGPWCAPTARRCASSPGCATSTSGSPGSTWTTSHVACRASPTPSSCAGSTATWRRRTARTACGRSAS